MAAQWAASTPALLSTPQRSGQGIFQLLPECMGWPLEIIDHGDFCPWSSSEFYWKIMRFLRKNQTHLMVHGSLSDQES